MKLLAISGSPRLGGNTDTLLDRAIEGAVSEGAEVEKIFLRSQRIAPCIECNLCFGTGRCAVQDDYQPLYDKTLESDGVMLASPVFFTNVSGWAKAFIDRFQCLWALKYILNMPIPPAPGGRQRRGVFLSTAGSPRTKFDCTLSTVRSFFATIDARLVGQLCINSVDELGAIAQHPEILQQAHELGVHLVKSAESVADE